MVEQRVEVASVLDEAVAVGPGVVELVGVAHADQVGRDAPAESRTCGMMLRHRYDEVGLPWRNTIVRSLAIDRAGVEVRHRLGGPVDGEFDGLLRQWRSGPHAVSLSDHRAARTPLGQAAT